MSTEEKDPVMEALYLRTGTMNREAGTQMRKAREEANAAAAYAKECERLVHESVGYALDTSRAAWVLTGNTRAVRLWTRLGDATPPRERRVVVRGMLDPAYVQRSGAMWTAIVGPGTDKVTLTDDAEWQLLPKELT